MRKEAGQEKKNEIKDLFVNGQNAARNRNRGWGGGQQLETLRRIIDYCVEGASPSGAEGAADDDRARPGRGWLLLEAYWWCADDEDPAPSAASHWHLWQALLRSHSLRSAWHPMGWGFAPQGYRNVRQWPHLTYLTTWRRHMAVRLMCSVSDGQVERCRKAKKEEQGREKVFCW